MFLNGFNFDACTNKQKFEYLKDYYFNNGFFNDEYIKNEFGYLLNIQNHSIIDYETAKMSDFLKRLNAIYKEAKSYKNISKADCYDK